MKSTDRPLLIFILLFTILFQLNTYGEERKLFRQMTAADGLSDNSAQAIKCTFSGRITVTTQGNINYYDGASFSQINNAQEVKYGLEDYQGKTKLYYDNSHHLWLKNNDGVVCVNLTTEQFIPNMDSLFVAYGAQSRVNNMFVDAGGDVWLCVNNHLYCQKYNYRIALRKNVNLQEIEVYAKKYLLMFYSDGQMVCHDVNTGRQIYHTSAYGAEDAKVYNRGCVLLILEDGFYLIRNSEKGAVLLYHDLKKRTWTEIMRQDFHLNNLVAHDGKLYISSEKGYFTYKFDTGDINQYTTLRLRNGRRLETDINVIEFDLQGGMWVGTETRGLLYSSPLNVSVHSIVSTSEEAQPYLEMMRPLKGISEFKGKKANMMLIDSRQWTWVGTPNGLELYKSPKADPVIYSRKNGLLNAVIHAIIEDDDNNIWASTSYGIVCLHIVDNEVMQTFCFSTDDNVPNETFMDAKAIKLPDGQIAMESLDHVVVFDPADFLSFFNMKPYAMYPKLTKLLVNGIDVVAGEKVAGDVVLERSITRTKEIDLNYEQNSISLTFSAMNYARPLKTYYRVRIREIDKAWTEYSYYNSNGLVDGRGLLHLPMSNLQPGTYHIEVLASPVEGEFIGTPYEWIVNVHQPWWRTTGIIAAFGLVVLVLLVLNALIFNRNTRLKVRRNNEEADIISRIKWYVERCTSYSHEKLSPTQEEIYGTSGEAKVDLSSDFVDLMLKTIPYVHERNGRPFSMHMLADATDMDVIELYELVTANIHKNPRILIRSIKIDEAAKLLSTTDKSVEEIAVECGFVSPNYMIAKFYHRFKMTPREYREELAQ